MQNQYDILQGNDQDASRVAQFLAQELEGFLAPLLQVFTCLLDKRLIDTFLQLLIAIVRFRNAGQGLVISELGASIRGYNKEVITAPAGAKRIGNFLRSLNWNPTHIDRYVLSEADKQVRALQAEGKQVLCIHESSVIEKPESDAMEGMCPVISSKAKRRTRSKKGQVFNEPRTKPIMVTGMHWKGALVAGLEGLAQVAVMRWSTTRGDYAENQRELEREIFRALVYKWGPDVWHIFDRGFASGPWLELTQALHAKVIIRWIKTHLFFDASGQAKKLWEIGRGKKYTSHKLVRDPKTGVKINCDLWWTPVTHTSYAGQLYLVKVRAKQQVMRLITNVRIRCDDEAWEIFFAYRRRWKIETAFRYGKSELAMESPCTKQWENTLKLLGVVTLVYSFLLHLLKECYGHIKEYVLRLKCHRTGTRNKSRPVPLYRLRWDLSRLWEEQRPVLDSFAPPYWHTARLFASLRGEKMEQKNSG